MRGRDAWWIAGLAGVFAPALLALARVWLSTDYYSHGFLVPVVAFWMFRAERRRLPPASAARRSGAGIACLAVAGAVYVVGLLAVDPTLQGLALVAAVAGVVLLRHGPEGLRAVALPVAFLLFMVPVPPAILTPIITGLQLWVSQMAVEVLQAVGFSVLREGNVVLLPGDQRLFVSEACSGITSIVTLLPLGVVLAWFTQPPGWRRWLLVASVVPFAMLGNGIRVLATVVGAGAWGVERVTSGAVHDLAGVLAFVLACLMLIGAGALLRRTGAAAPA